MAAQKGREILIKRNGVTVAGMRQKGLTINGAPAANISDSESTWEEFLAGAGLKSFSVQGSGVFKDSASENAVVTDVMTDAENPYEIVVPGLGSFSGNMICTGISLNGGHTSEVSYQMGWQATGVVTKT